MDTVRVQCLPKTLLFMEQIFQFKVVCQECVEGEGGSFYKHQKLRMNIRLGSL
jgi:hypothetical protein